MHFDCAGSTKKIAAAMAALDSLMAHPGVSKVARAAGAIGMFCPLKNSRAQDHWANYGGSTGRGTR